MLKESIGLKSSHPNPQTSHLHTAFTDIWGDSDKYWDSVDLHLGNDVQEYDLLLLPGVVGGGDVPPVVVELIHANLRIVHLIIILPYGIYTILTNGGMRR